MQQAWSQPGVSSELQNSSSRAKLKRACSMKTPEKAHHCECKHDAVKFCQRCLAVHCLACGHEWVEGFSPYCYGGWPAQQNAPVVWVANTYSNSMHEMTNAYTYTPKIGTACNHLES